MRIVTWNVNGLRSCETKGFSRWLAASGAEIVGVQEVRAKADQLPETVRQAPGWHLHVVGRRARGVQRRRPLRAARARRRSRPRSARRASTARAASSSRASGGSSWRTSTSRTATARTATTAASPTSSTSTARCFERLERLRRGGKRVLVMGDFNTAHREIDLARPKENVKTSGFTPIEREELDRWIRARLGRHVPPLRARARATTRGGASASACARRTSAGASTTCSRRRTRSRTCRARSSTRT